MLWTMVSGAAPSLKSGTSFQPVDSDLQQLHGDLRAHAALNYLETEALIAAQMNILTG